MIYARTVAQFARGYVFEDFAFDVCNFVILFCLDIVSIPINLFR